MMYRPNTGKIYEMLLYKIYFKVDYRSLIKHNKMILHYNGTREMCLRTIFQSVCSAYQNKIYLIENRHSERNNLLHKLKMTASH